ncbi:MAG TPA: hypothetical protein VL096_04475 [Pirellulaceae bacterium]|nr:hypothetical protein [Pirellulaceae bacterium]
MKRLLLAVVGVAWCCSLTLAQEAKTPDAKQLENKPVAIPDQAKLFKQFEESLTGAKMTGSFTIIGKDNKDLKGDAYTIISVTKLPEGDYWLFKAKFKETTIPLPIEVKWAGDTPVITLTDFTIPGMGTFSSRVMIYRNAYAGWWQHGEVVGHMFGTIEKEKK